MSAFQVDVDELSEAVRAMAACGRALADLHADIGATTTTLLDEWAGLAGDAHATSHARWSDEFASMSSALGALRDVGDTARVNYSNAVELNVSLWEQVR